ncbi:aa3-type cytochrome c oxidase subunit IV [Paracoccus sp. (in: a-proteobacteria)]|uniref:aa3-type cytochrome c oxidase subunit IV n=1 Tax=Paracoccus sp. TaxID=267 RepID=UPI00396CE3DC
MADYDNKPEATQGTMDLTAHKKTFAGFIRIGTWVVILSLVVLVFLALTNA